MPATTMQVQLLTMTPDAEALIYAAMRQCYSDGDAAKIFDQAVSDIGFGHDKKIYALINKVMKSGHESPIECVSFSFAIIGVSRALSHQLVRHRIASYSQQSQRYVKVGEFDYIMPPSIAAIPEARARYEAAMEQAGTAYAELQEILARHGRGDKANEDARFVLPNACETKVVVTMNCRSLLHFFEERCCQRAQWEIRALANAMLATCKERLPVVFSSAGPKCVRLGYCEEHKSCGRYPKRGE